MHFCYRDVQYVYFILHGNSLCTYIGILVVFSSHVEFYAVTMRYKAIGFLLNRYTKLVEVLLSLGFVVLQVCNRECSF